MNCVFASKGQIWKLALSGLAVSAGLGLFLSQAQPASGSVASVPEAKVIGASKCKSCHNKEETGSQFTKWQESKHAKAFEVLASDAAKEAAKAKGIADPQKADECLKCHVTGHGMAAEAFQGKWDDKQIAMGVQCETCHGGGGDHMKARMAAATAKDKPELQAIGAGEIQGAVAADLCKKCHNKESPTYKEFCYHKATKAIAHADPTKDHGEPKMGCDDPCHCKGDCTHKCGG